jgi:hypothetical protein
LTVWSGNRVFQHQLPITLIEPDFGEGKAQVCTIAFPENSGWSQVDFAVSSVDKVFSPAESPLSPVPIVGADIQLLTRFG